MPDISIIITSFNSERYILRAVDSALRQTLQDIEIIVVDDGSTDQTASLIKSIPDRRVKYIYKENGGCASARNMGIAIATGKYIGFIDSDDFVCSTMYDTLYKLGKEYDADVVDGSFVMIDEKEEDCFRFSQNGEEGIISLKDGKEMVLTANRDRSLWFVWKGIYRTSMLKNLSFPEHLSLGEETPFVLECFLKANKVVETDEKMYCYVQRSGSMTHQKYRSGYFDKLNDLYIEKKKVYERNCIYGYEDDLNQYTMEHSLPMILSNEIKSGKSFAEQRLEFKRIRESKMITEAFYACSTNLIRSRLRYMAVLLKYKMYTLLAVLCR